MRSVLVMFTIMFIVACSSPPVYSPPAISYPSGHKPVSTAAECDGRSRLTDICQAADYAWYAAVKAEMDADRKAETDRSNKLAKEVDASYRAETKRQAQEERQSKKEQAKKVALAKKNAVASVPGEETRTANVPPAVDNLEARGLCSKIERSLNITAEFTKTACIPALDDGKLGFILMSYKPVFSLPKAKRAWVVLAAATTGYVMNEHPQIKVGDVVLTDSNLIVNRQGFKLSIATAKSLQKQTKADQIDVVEMHRQLSALMVTLTQY